MADFRKAADFVLRNEDETLSGRVTPDPTDHDPRAVARFGVNSQWHPELIACGFYDESKVTCQQALWMAEDVFKLRYFGAIRGYSIIPQDIANKWADLAFNEGPEQATKIVQRAVNYVLPNMQPRLQIDGLVGDQTIGRVNAAEPERLLPTIKEQAKNFYLGAASTNARIKSDLKGLLLRVEK